MQLALTRRADYAVRAMLCLARAGGERLSGPTIAATTGSPPRFVTQVMGDLVAAGLVRATLGRSGGYRLAKSARRISILDIVGAIEGDARRRTCVLRAAACRGDRACEVHEIFSSAQDALLERLAMVTLASAAAGPNG
ncbi:MAG TPA: Rrf2 family transcriptional regulator [Candidatus Limnocylindrales bacterium]